MPGSKTTGKPLREGMSCYHIFLGFGFLSEYIEAKRCFLKQSGHSQLERGQPGHLNNMEKTGDMYHESVMAATPAHSEAKLSAKHDLLNAKLKVHFSTCLDVISYLYLLNLFTLN